MDMHTDKHTDMQHGHGHAEWIWTCSMDLDRQHRSGHAVWTCSCSMDLDKECRNADEKLSPASLIFCQFTTLSPASAFRHHGQSGTASQGLVR
jgi:hypothetical protein